MTFRCHYRTPLIHIFERPEFTLSHSHLPVQHLMKRMETWQPGQGGDRRPDWLTHFVEEAAELLSADRADG